MKRLFAVLFTVGISLGLSAQPDSKRLAYTEFGIGVGTLNYVGDIATTTSTAALFEETRPNATAFIKRHLNDWFGMGLQASYGWIYANDFNHDRQMRGLEVSTTMFQVNPFVEVSLLRFGKYHYERKFTVYGKAGGGFLAYNPEPSASSVYPEYLDPRPNAYTSINVFGGGGMKFLLSKDLILSFEVTVHNSLTDDLDGVLHVDPAVGSADDIYGGVNVYISKAIF